MPDEYGSCWKLQEFSFRAVWDNSQAESSWGKKAKVEIIESIKAEY